MSTSSTLNDFATDLALARPNPCRNCGPWPCYHICPNSPHYYSVEQERYDDAQDFGRYDDVHERYANSGEYGFDDEYDDEPDIPFIPPVREPVGDTDDIPF